MRQRQDDVRRLRPDEGAARYRSAPGTRLWEGMPALLVRGVFTIFALCGIGMALITGIPEEVRMSLFLAMIVFAGILLFPAGKADRKVNYMPWYDILMAVLGAGVFLYFAFHAQEILLQGVRLSGLQLVIGAAGLMILLEVARRSVGWPVLIVVLLFLAHAMVFGLTNPSLAGRARYLVRSLFYTKQGIFSEPVSVCSGYIVVFIVLGALLEQTGVADYFIQLAERAVGSFAGGSAKAAVLASTLCGMISGSSADSTAMTGRVTIPRMKEAGYAPSYAGAVEAAASAGSQIMPPVMGAAAFVMAELLGVPYGDVLRRAVLPAILYFAGIFFAVHLKAKKEGTAGIPRERLPKLPDLLRRSFLPAPILLLVLLLLSGLVQIRVAAVIAILAVIASGILGESIDRSQPFPVSAIAAALESSARTAVTIGASCSAAGILAGTLTMTGFGGGLPEGLSRLAEGRLFPALLLVMLFCIVLGMAVPMTVAYCLAAVLCAPVLARAGLPLPAAHFFVLYFGVAACITPPVALAAYGAGAIARSNPLRTAVTACRIASAAFIVPFMFAYDPALLLIDASPLRTAWAFGTSLAGIIGVCAALEGYLFTEMHPAVRILAAAGGLLMIAPGRAADLCGLAAVAACIVIQMLRRRREEQTPEEEPEAPADHRQ